MVEQISTSDVRSGAKVLVEGQPYSVSSNEFMKPGKGQPFNRIKLKHLLTGRVVERTFKSGEKLEIADVEECSMRLLYTDPENAVFMDDKSFEQISIALSLIGDTAQWLLEDQLYSIVIYNGNPISVEAPTFIELTVVQTEPGARGDTSGRVLKPAILNTGAKVQVPLFIDEGEKVKFDTRTAEYVSRSGK